RLPDSGTGCGHTSHVQPGRRPRSWACSSHVVRRWHGHRRRGAPYHEPPWEERLSAPPSPPSHALSRPVLLRLVDVPQPDAAWARTEPLQLCEPRPPGDSPIGPVRPPTTEQATALVTATVRALLEVIEGRRPPRQLAPMLGSEVLDQLETLVSLG